MEPIDEYSLDVEFPQVKSRCDKCYGTGESRLRSLGHCRYCEGRGKRVRDMKKSERPFYILSLLRPPVADPMVIEGTSPAWQYGDGATLDSTDEEQQQFLRDLKDSV